MHILYLNNSVHLGGDTKCILKLSKEFSNKENKVVIASNGGIMKKEFEKNEILHYMIGDVENKSLLNIIKIIKQIRRILKSENIEIIHSHHRMTTLLAKLAIKNLNIRLIHTQHLCIEDKFILTKLALKNIQIITVSEAAKRILVEKCKLYEKNIATIYNTIETNSENKVVDNRLLELKKGGYFIVAQISRLVDYKGIYDFIEIAKKTCLEKDKIKFVLLGDGPERNNIENVINKQKLENKVYLLGAKDNILEHLKYIDIVLLCSYIEGLPLVPLEAFSQRVPVIATNINGTNEEIEDGINGYLVEMKDINEFSNRILELYNNKNLYNSLKDNAYNIYNSKFNNCKYVKQHNTIYKKLIKKDNI